MRRPSATLTEDGLPFFAALGHQESWEQILAIVAGMREGSARDIEIEDLRDIIPWIPPRTVSRFSVGDLHGDVAARGVYIETFLAPDKLSGPGNSAAIQKVRDAIEAARREGAPIATLGGFTSILMEAGALPPVDNIVVTTGNSLTAALILKGLDRALRLTERRLENEIVLVIGATGDVGSACARGLAGRTRSLALAARNRGRLLHLANELSREGDVSYSHHLPALLATATVIVAAASTAEPTFDMSACAPGTLICDAGYPKNFRTLRDDTTGPRVFWGGMGQLKGGIRSQDGVLERFYNFPAPGVAHGCILEGAVLALARRHESFSGKRGLITADRLDEIWALAQQHGVTTAPLFNHLGLWPEECANSDARLGDRKGCAG